MNPATSQWPDTGRAKVVGVEPRSYRIEVQGELGPRYQAAFGTMRLEAAAGSTMITGPVQDQAELQGLLDTIAALGLSLLNVTSTVGNE